MAAASVFLPQRATAPKPLGGCAFDSRRLFYSRVKNGEIRQRTPAHRPGAFEGQAALVNLHAIDGGFSEWRKLFFDPLIKAGAPPHTNERPTIEEFSAGDAD